MATATEHGRLVKLRLVVHTDEAPAHDIEVEVEADGATPAAAVAEAFERELGVAANELVVARSGRPLAEETPLARFGLAHGDELGVADGRAPPPEPPAAAEIVVSGGPATSARHRLAAGEHALGRDASCDIVVDDPAMSARHLVLRVADGGDVDVVDAGSSNGTLVDGVSIEPGEPARLEPGQVIQAGRTLLELAPLPQPAAASSPAGDGTIPFNRPPRVYRPLERRRRPFPPPPADPHRSRLPMAAALLPLLLGVALYYVTGYPTMLLFGLLSPVLAVGTYLEDRRSGRRGFSEATRSYRQRLVALRAELEQERERELRRRRASTPSAPELVRRALRREAALWERRPDDADFLALRLGTTDEQSTLAVQLDPGGSEELRAEAEALAAWYATVPAAPVVAPLADLGALGLCGPPERVAGLGRWLVAQAATLHSPRELVVAAAVSDSALDDWQWLKWLPHAQYEGGPLPTRLAAGHPAARELLESVAELAAERRRDAESRFGGSQTHELPGVLLIVDERVAPERSLVAQALAGGPETGIAAVWLGRQRRDLPGECRGIVELDPGVFRLDLHRRARRRRARRRHRGDAPRRRRASRRARARTAPGHELGRRGRTGPRPGHAAGAAGAARARRRADRRALAGPAARTPGHARLDGRRTVHGRPAGRRPTCARRRTTGAGRASSCRR